MGKITATATVLMFGGAVSAAMADRVNVASDANVARSVERLNTAVEAAGARVFTTVDFQRGAASVGEELRPTTVVIFGSPKIGSAALQEGQTMALYLPLRILFFEDENGQTWATYDEPTAIAASHGLSANNAAVLQMKAALARFSSVATGGGM
ncbi:DUF302 domain-containing protein [Shimia sp.]|uniref:DUF302 domain-containing protein n=1 Tax=Shimia sp. TaxID=1954381 RepID=UPI0032989394